MDPEIQVTDEMRYAGGDALAALVPWIKADDQNLYEAARMIYEAMERCRGTEQMVKRVSRYLQVHAGVHHNPYLPNNQHDNEARMILEVALGLQEDDELP
jgi:hypothetical protein